MWDWVLDVGFWRAIAEILILAVLFYHVWRMFRSTSAARIFIGLTLALMVLLAITYFLKLEVIGWLLGRIITPGLVGLVILFQPELRRLLAKLGNAKWGAGKHVWDKKFLDDFCSAVATMSAKRIGALFAFEGKVEMSTIRETGVALDSKFSPELALSMFYKGTALHDGGVVIKRGRIVTAACVFPVNNMANIDRSMGLRHRAGMGVMDEYPDAIIVVVSEESGRITLMSGGKCDVGISVEKLREKLEAKIEFKEFGESND